MEGVPICVCLLVSTLLRGDVHIDRVLLPRVVAARHVADLILQLAVLHISIFKKVFIVTGLGKQIF